MIEHELTTLKNLFVEHTALLRELSELLVEQKEAIVRWNLESLTHIQRKHQQIVLKMRVYDQARQHGVENLCRTLKCHPTINLNELLNSISHPDVEDLKLAYNSMLAAAGAAQELYKENQKYLDFSKNGVEMSFSLLRSSRKGSVRYERAGADKARITPDDEQTRYVSERA